VCEEDGEVRREGRTSKGVYQIDSKEYGKLGGDY
jgi:hypothetical protein